LDRSAFEEKERERIFTLFTYDEAVELRGMQSKPVNSTQEV
jgi:hypothetical protein